MKPADVNSSTYIDFNKTNNKENPKFEVGDKETFSERFTFQIGLKRYCHYKI